MKDNGTEILIEIYPFVAEAISYNEGLYKDVDELYSKYKYEFYRCAKDDKYYNHRIIKEKSMVQEEYARKALGIFALLKNFGDEDMNINEEQLSDIKNSLDDMLKKGWPYVFAYIDNHVRIDIIHFMNSFIRKNKGIENVSTADLNGIIAILFFATINSKKTFVYDGHYNKFLQTFYQRLKMNLIDDRTPLSTNNNFSEEYKGKIKNLKDKINSICKKVNTFDDFYDLACSYFPTEVVDLMVTPKSNLSLVDALKDTRIGDKELEESLCLYTTYLEKMKDEHQRFPTHDEMMLFLMFRLSQSFLVKHYEQMKEYHFKNNKETLFIEMEEIQNKLKVKEDELKRVQKEKADLETTILRQEKQIAKLESAVNELSANNEELYGLREYVFAMNECMDFDITGNVDYDSLKNISGAVIGGHPRWQEKMKEQLPHFVYLSIDNINFDIDVLNKCDIVFINVRYMSHGLYYKVINAIRKNKKRVVYINQNTNISMNVEQMYKAVFKGKKTA